MNYTQFVDEKMHAISKEKIILDVGGGDKFQKWLSKYKPLFEHTEYKTMDYDATTNPTIVGDIHAIPLLDESVDAIICSSVLEHVNNPVKATEEMYRILKKGGKLFIYVPSIYPYHARKGHYPDMWRFFDDSLKYLCRDFSQVELCKFGGYFKALAFFVPFQHKLQWLLKPATKALDTLFSTTTKRNTTAGYFVYAIK